MAARNARDVAKVEEPIAVVEETEPEVNELDSVEVSEADVEEYEASAAEPPEEETEPIESDKASIEEVSDKSVVEETDEVTVTFTGMKEMSARAPSKIQVLIPLDGTEPDDSEAYISHGVQYDFVPGQTRTVEPEHRSWLLRHLVYKFE